MDDLEYHPLANLFPLIEGEEFDALVGDIRVNGLHDAIDLFQGKILDGRNRWRAAKAAGVELERRNFRHYHAEIYGDPLAYVISKNLSRRHLDESQRAMVAARLATMRQGERTDLAAEPSANLPKVNQPTAAKTLSISERALRHARRVQDSGTPELVRAVDRGRLAVSVADKASRLPADIQRKIAAEAEAGNVNAARNVVKQEARGERERDLADKQRALPQRKYGVILADPEWRFEVYSRETGMDRAADNHYPTSETDAICARPVRDIAAADCVLFLWATAPMLPDALRVMQAWGFAYKAQAIWVKDRIGTGYWFRNKHELLLVGTRGNIPAPAMGTQWPSVIEAPAGEHSAKPDRFHELIESYFPSLPKIELNARRARPGWDAWGLEAPTEVAAPEPTASADANEIPESPKASDLAMPLPSAASCQATPSVPEPAPESRGSPQTPGAGSLSSTNDIDLEIPPFLRRKSEGAEAR